MANHASAKKRIRASNTKRIRNRYQKRTCLTLIKKLRKQQNFALAAADLPKVLSAIDKVAKRNIFHKNKSARLKSQLTRYIFLGNKTSIAL